MFNLEPANYGLLLRAGILTAIGAAWLWRRRKNRQQPPIPPSIKPELKQFADLQSGDFDRHPVWIAVHGADSEEPWYDDKGIDEETFRPWLGQLPVSPSDGMFLIRGVFHLPDGSPHPGFATPATAPNDLGLIQPQIFVNNRMFGFWGGLTGGSPKERGEFYQAIGKTAAEVFPLTFSADPQFTPNFHSIHIQGFYRLPQIGQPPVLER